MISRKHKKIKVGYEIECFLLKSKRYGFSWIKEKIKALYSGIEIGDDDSLEDYNDYENYYNYETDEYDVCSEAIEIRTPPLPANEAVKLLKKVLKVVEKYGFTNETCGLHLNFSTTDSEQKKHFNPILLGLHDNQKINLTINN